MTVGFVMLVHRDMNRVEQVAKYWANSGCPVVIHVDTRLGEEEFSELSKAVEGHPKIQLSSRRECNWGQFSIVEASQVASEQLLDQYPEVSHVFLASGSCLPVKPVSELNKFLLANKRTDFIESVTTEEVTWTVGGLDLERFTLSFPFSWKKHRQAFDKYVEIQRKLGVQRRIPDRIEPHLGSQWWCLTRQTLSAILEDPKRKQNDRYYRKVWIPDEAYFQSLVRNFSTNIDSRSLTLSKFDHQGKPHIFYDDHMQILLRSDAFVARKIWPKAERLYWRFLNDKTRGKAQIEPNPRKLDRIFKRAADQRVNGREGLIMQSRFPADHMWGLKRTCAPYSVYEGFSDLFSNFEIWLEKRTGTRVHGHLFHKRKVKFSGGSRVYNGCLSNSAKLRDYNPKAFLSNLIWSTQGEHQSFQFGPADVQDIGYTIAEDPNATISIVSGAWVVPLFHSNLNFARIRKIAARFQKTEAMHIEALKSHHVRAKVQVWTLAEFVEDPMPILQSIIDALDPGASRKLTEVPKMADLTGFGQFVQNLRNQGMNPHLLGDFPTVSPAAEESAAKKPPHKPYVVR